MADYTYTGVSIYMNYEEMPKKDLLRNLYELSDRLYPLAQRIPRVFPEGPSEDDLFSEYALADRQLQRDSNIDGDFFYGGWETMPGNTPDDKQQVQLTIVDDKLHLFIPIATKRKNNRVLQPVLEQVYESFADILHQVSYLTLMEYEDYEKGTPTVLIRNGQPV